MQVGSYCKLEKIDFFCFSMENIDLFNDRVIEKTYPVSSIAIVRTFVRASNSNSIGWPFLVSDAAIHWQKKRCSALALSPLPWHSPFLSWKKRKKHHFHWTMAIEENKVWYNSSFEDIPLVYHLLRFVFLSNSYSYFVPPL